MLGAQKDQALRVLMIHDRYVTRGGEDESTDMEAALLREHGHVLDILEMDNRAIARRRLLQTSVNAVWSRSAYRAVQQRLREGEYDLVHIQNFFPLFSPSVHYAVKSKGTPLVQSLHNYRLLCLNGMLFRSGRACEDCIGKLMPWPGVLHGCYRDSRAGSLVVASMLLAHRSLRTWSRKVDAFIAYSEFARDKLVQGGLPRERLIVKPNFVHPDPGRGGSQRDFVLMVGRLTEDKGILTLLEAWQQLAIPIPLKIIGDGPLGALVGEAARMRPWIESLGRLPLSEVYDQMGRARLLIFPTRLYETFGRVIIEAFAKETPVLASEIGAGGRLVEQGRTGLHFRSGDASDLAAKVQSAWEHPEECQRMGREGRRKYEQEYSSERNYALLMSAYETAIESNRSGGGRREG